MKIPLETPSSKNSSSNSEYRLWPCHDKRFVACYLSWKYGFDFRPIHVAFEVDKDELGQVFLGILRVSSGGTTNVHTYLFIHLSAKLYNLSNWTSLFNNTLKEKKRNTSDNSY